MFLDSDAIVIEPSYTVEHFIREYISDTNYSIVTPLNCYGKYPDGRYACWKEEDGEDITPVNIAMIGK
jgi:hypothetical protein